VKTTLATLTAQPDSIRGGVVLAQLAYIDPGSGSLIIQAAIAVLVGIPFFFRTQIGRAARVIRKSVGRQPNEVDPNNGGGSTGS
jgi:hypothetical protein